MRLAASGFLETALAVTPPWGGKAGYRRVAEATTSRCKVTWFGSYATDNLTRSIERARLIQCFFYGVKKSGGATSHTGKNALILLRSKRHSYPLHEKIIGA